ncbi:hypothetical protein VCHENC02_0793A, partial [Vibrio harveyi]
MTRKLG